MAISHDNMLAEQADVVTNSETVVVWEYAHMHVCSAMSSSVFHNFRLLIIDMSLVLPF